MKHRSIILKSLLLVAAAAALVALGILLCVQASDAVYRSLQESARMGADFGAGILRAEVERTAEDFDAAEEGAYAATYADRRLTFGGRTYGVVTQVLADNLAAETLLFNSLTELTGGVLEDETMCAVVPVGETVYLRRADRFLAGVSAGAFTATAVCAENGRVLAQAGVSGVQRLDPSAFASGGTEKIGDTTYYLYADVIETGGNVSYRFVGLYDVAESSARIRGYRIRTSVTVLFCEVILVLFAELLYLADARERKRYAALLEPLDQGFDGGFRRGFRELDLTGQPFLVGEIEINDLSGLRLMFGESFVEAVRELFYNKLKEIFGRVYFLPEGFGVLYGGSGKSVKHFLEDLPRYMEELNQPVRVRESLVLVGCRAGFSLIEKENREFAQATQCTRGALRRAQTGREPTFFVYHEYQRKQYLKYMENVVDVRGMMEEGCFTLEYQPQFSLRDNRIVGFEALFRIRKVPDFEITVQELINYAERTGCMILLGDFIFRTGMKFAKSVEGKGVTVSLNVSPVQLMQTGFADHFLKLYEEFALPEKSVAVEITESFLMSNFEENVHKIRQLAEAGIAAHLDDFGTTYSSLLYLKKVPASVIKIDREFIKDLETNEYSRTITQTVIDVAHELGMETIAEGVENERQYEMLAKMGCDIVQGYLIGKSLSEEEARKRL